MWVELSTSDLDDHKIAALVTALKTAALGLGQQDPVPRLLSDAIAEVRAAIGSSFRNVLPTDSLTSVPQSLRGLTLRICLRVAKARLEMELTADEQAERDADQARLARIISGDERVDRPDGATVAVAITSDAQLGSTGVMA